MWAGDGGGGGDADAEALFTRGNPPTLAGRPRRAPSSMQPRTAGTAGRACTLYGRASAPTRRPAPAIPRPCRRPHRLRSQSMWHTRRVGLAVWAEVEGSASQPPPPAPLFSTAALEGWSPLLPLLPPPPDAILPHVVRPYRTARPAHTQSPEMTKRDTNANGGAPRASAIAPAAAHMEAHANGVVCGRLKPAAPRTGRPGIRSRRRVWARQARRRRTIWGERLPRSTPP